MSPEVIEASLPAAEYYGVAMGLEVHPRLDLRDPWVQTIVNMARRHQTKFIGLIPDFGIFGKGLGGAQLNFLKIMGEKLEVIEYVRNAFQQDVPLKELMNTALTMGAGERTMGLLRGSQFMAHYCEPTALKGLTDVILHFHGKFNYMSENCEELTINYEEPIRILKESGWNGYISSEFEGQRAYHGQECPYEEDEIEQVRRHHLMLRRYIGE